MLKTQRGYRFHLFHCIGLIALILLVAVGCGQRQSQNEPSEDQGTRVAESEAPSDSAAPPQEAPQQEAPPAPTERERVRSEQPRRATGPETERPSRLSTPPPPAPPVPETVSVTVPQATQLKVKLDDALDSGTSQAGDHFQATLVDPVVIGDRVALPAGSTIEGTVSEVIPAKKGLKESGGALTLSFDRVTTPSGETAAMRAGISQVAKSTKKKAGTIGGSAAGGALLGKILGKSSKDAAVGAIIGGAIGTGIAAGTKGTEMKMEAGTELAVSLQAPLTVHLKR